MSFISNKISHILSWIGCLLMVLFVMRSFMLFVVPGKSSVWMHASSLLDIVLDFDSRCSLILRIVLDLTHIKLCRIGS